MPGHRDFKHRALRAKTVSISAERNPLDASYSFGLQTVSGLVPLPYLRAATALRKKSGTEFPS